MPTQQLPFDFATQQESLKRRQALIDAMMQSSITPDQGRFISNSAGTFYAGGGVLGGVAKALGLLAAQKSQEGLDAEQSTLAQRYSEGLKQALRQYESTRAGTPARTYPAPDTDPASTATVEAPAVPGDPRKAAIEAVASSYAPLRDIGMSDLKEAQKEGLTLKDLLPHANPASIPAMITGGMGGFQPKQELKAFSPGEPILDVNSGNVFTPKGLPGAAAPGMPSGPGWGTTNIGGDIYQSSATGLKKLDNAAKVNVSTNNSTVVAGQKEGVKKYFEHAAAQVDSLGKQANASQQLLTTLGTLQQLHNAGIYSNLGSGAATALANVGQSLGVPIDAAKLGRTETYNSLITDLWQRAVSQYGGNRGVTAAEAEEIRKLTPLASTSPQARERLFAIQASAARRNIAAYQEANKSFAGAAAADDPRLFQIPGYVEQAYTPGAANSPNPSQGSSGGFTILNVREK